MTEIIPRIDYGYLLVLFLCVGFFAKGAELDGRSPVVWGGLSLAAWLGFTQLLAGGLVQGLLSQAVLYAGATGWTWLREGLGGPPGSTPPAATEDRRRAPPGPRRTGGRVDARDGAGGPAGEPPARRFLAGEPRPRRRG